MKNQLLQWNLDGESVAFITQRLQICGHGDIEEHDLFLASSAGGSGGSVREFL